MDFNQNLNAPVQYVDTINGVELWIKREDLIHPFVSGNKWRKLKYFIEDFKRSDKTSILTFGGAFSNHIAATAAYGGISGIVTKALVRGEEIVSNTTIDFCRSQGMEVEPISRKQYDTKDNPEFLEMMEVTLPEVYIIPEGGKGARGLKGCIEIMDDVEEGFDVVACAGGTGTTQAGLLCSSYETKYLLFPALKGGKFLNRAIAEQLLKFDELFSTDGNGKKNWQGHFDIIEKYHFGGYAKVTPELVEFMNDFYKKYGIALDPVYTGKMMYGLFEMIKKGEIGVGKKVLAIHTGGLQGIAGMNERLKKKGIQIEYEV